MPFLLCEPRVEFRCDAVHILAAKYPAHFAFAEVIGYERLRSIALSLLPRAKKGSVVKKRCRSVTTATRGVRRKKKREINRYFGKPWEFVVPSPCQAPQLFARIASWSLCGVWGSARGAKAFGAIVKIKGDGGNVRKGTGFRYGETLGKPGAGNVPTVSSGQKRFPIRARSLGSFLFGD